MMIMRVVFDMIIMCFSSHSIVGFECNGLHTVDIVVLLHRTTTTATAAAVGKFFPMLI